MGPFTRLRVAFSGFSERASLYSSSPLQLNDPKLRVVRQKCSIRWLHTSLPSQKTTDITLLHPLCGSKGPVRGCGREKSAARCLTRAAAAARRWSSIWAPWSPVKPASRALLCEADACPGPFDGWTHRRQFERTRGARYQIAAVPAGKRLPKWHTHIVWMAARRPLRRPPGVVNSSPCC